MTLDEVLAPLTWEEFRDAYLGKQYWLSQGQSRRLAELVTWDDLNDALSHLRVAGKRMRLVKDGKDFPPDSYLFSAGHEQGSTLRSRECVRHLSAGATLVVNQVDELFDNVKQFAESCEDRVRHYIGVNLYAGWRTTKGLDQHWDRHDTLILQLQGTKHWTVWAPTRLHPLEADVEDVPKPQEPPVWDGLLEEGDVLYMPRGWWHIARPLDRPSLHLTAGFYHPTGVDLLQSVVRHVTSQVSVRRDIPHWEPPDARAAWIAELRAIVSAALEPEIIDRFMRSRDADMQTRPLWFLPHDVTERSPAIGPHTRLRLRHGSRLHIKEGAAGEPASFRVKGAEWKIDSRLVPALRLLHHNRASSLTEMSHLLDPVLRTTLHAVITSFVLGDVVWAEPKREVVPEAVAEASHS